MYKSKLQELCHQKQWALPRYTSMKDGPDHDPCFKSSVFVNGTSFDSSLPCKSSKGAQNDAAKYAYLHFTSSSHSLAVADGTTGGDPNPDQEVDSGVYNYTTLLHELAQREGWTLPDYTTEKRGVPHSPFFFSSVKVKGDVFYGKKGKSGEEAELNVARFAYTDLIERFPGSKSGLCSLQDSAGEHLQVVSNTSVSVTPLGTEEYGEENEVQKVKGGEELAISTTSIDNSASFSEFVPVSDKEVSSLQVSKSGLCSPQDFSSEHLQVGSKLVSVTTVGTEEYGEEIEVQDVEVGGKELAKSTTSTDSSASCSKFVPVSVKEVREVKTGGKGGSIVDIAALSLSEHSNSENDPRSGSYLLNNRYRVYRCYPDHIAFPQGITVLPISEDKWVAVSLEFPKETK